MHVEHDACGHEWDYTGNREPGEYVTCPRCYSKTRLPEGASADV